jgi:hypothetical protein
MSRSQKTVQAVHGAAEYLIRESGFSWDNGTVILKKVPDENGLMEQINKIIKLNIPYRVFKEPDMDNSVTSIAVIARHHIFKELPLL